MLLRCNIKSIKFPKSLKGLGLCSLRETEITELDLGNTELSMFSFNTVVKCNKLKTVILPDSLKTIEISYIETCKNLKEIRILGNNNIEWKRVELEYRLSPGEYV